MVRAVAPGAAMLTRKALPAGAEAVSRSSSKVTVRAVPSTFAQTKAGGAASWKATTLALAPSPDPVVTRPRTVIWYVTARVQTGKRVPPRAGGKVYRFKVLAFSDAKDLPTRRGLSGGRWRPVHRNLAVAGARLGPARGRVGDT